MRQKDRYNLIDQLSNGEKVLIKGQRYNIKKLIIIMAIIGLAVSIILAVFLFFQNVDYYKANVYTYKLHSIPGNATKTYGTSWMCYCDICCSFNDANSVEDFVLDKLLSEPYYLIPIILVVLLCGLLYFLSYAFELIVTDKRILGKIAGAKKIGLPLALVSAVTISEITKGIVLSTTSGRIRFLLIKNSNDIYKIINNHLLSICQKNTPDTITAPQSTEREIADDTVKNDSEISEQYTDCNKKQVPCRAVQLPSVFEKTKHLLGKYRKSTAVLSVFIFISVIIVIACSLEASKSSSYNSNDYNYTTKSYYTTKAGYDESYLETIVVSELYDELCNHKSGMLTYSYDLGSTKYSIGSIVEDNGVYIIRGTFSLYDYYGKISPNHYNETFTVKVSGSTYTCTTSLD